MESEKHILRENQLDDYPVQKGEEFNYNLDREASALLWSNLTRHDGLYEVTNKKAQGLIAFNTFAMGGVMLNFELLCSHGNHVINLGFLGVLVILVSSIISIYTTIRVIAPHIKTRKYDTGEELSLIFHEEILTRSLEQYIHDCKTTINLLEDMVKQTYALAVGLTKKFKYISIAIRCILFGHIPGIALLVLSYIFNI